MLQHMMFVFFFKQKTAYEMRISDWSSDVCSSDLGSGAVGVAPEPDGIIRRVPLLIEYQGKVFPSLAAEALRIALGASTYVVKSAGASGVMSFGEATGISEIRNGDAIVPTDPRSEGRRVEKECCRPCRSRWSPDK